MQVPKNGFVHTVGMTAQAQSVPTKSAIEWRNSEGIEVELRKEDVRKKDKWMRTAEGTRKESVKCSVY